MSTSMSQQEILAQLQVANDILRNVHVAIQKQNTEDKQFDYVTNAYLSSLSNHCRELATKIDNIVMQEEK